MSTDTLSEAGLGAAELAYGRLIDAAKSIEAYDKITDAQRCAAIICAYLAASQEAAAPSEEPVAYIARGEDDMPERIWAGDFDAEGFGHCVAGMQGGLYAEYVRADLASPAVAPVATITLNMAATSTEMQTLKPCEKHPDRYCNCEGFYPACRSTDEVKP